MIAPALSIPRPARWATWLVFVALSNGIVIFSSLATGVSSAYHRLAMPSWAPPSWVLAPVWITLSTLVGTATYFVWSQTDGSLRRRALGAFGVQLALGALWISLFFGLAQPGLALVVVLAYWFAVAAVLSVYGLLVPVAGWLVAPLWLWVSYLAALDATTWWVAR
jgi:tryptophan-rich sensory protein